MALGLASSGVHSNGYSLVRRIVDATGLGWDAPAPFGEGTLAEALLAPTRIYVRPALAAIRSGSAGGSVRGLAHITGGGLTENVPRVLPDGLGIEIDLGAWALPPVFGWLIREGGLEQAEALRTFNCGIGMVVIAAPEAADDIAAGLAAAGEVVHRIGTVTGGRGVSYRGALG